jgi:hypothetical protein
MGRPSILIGYVSLAALFAAGEAHAQLTDPPPCTVLNAEACHPAACSVFWDGPCFLKYGTPSGQALRMTVAASDGSAPSKPANDQPVEEAQSVNTLREMFAAIRDCWEPPPPDKSRPGMEYTIIFAFKRNGELIAPPRMTYATHDVPDEVRGNYREAVEATLKRCTPMHFTTSMAGAIAGRPIGMHFFDDRIVPDHFKGGDNSGK